MIPNLIDNPHFNWSKLFENSQHSLEEVYFLHKEKRITSFPLNAELSFKGEFTRRDFIASNIIGMIEGSDPKLKDSYLIVSAHYDHLGIGEAVAGDSVYNGVYDNAIGLAALIEAAKVFSNLTVKPKRSIIFLLPTGEEHGLLGSIYYTDHPVVPLHKTVANINIDGLASFDRFKSIVAVGYEYSTLDRFLNETARQVGLKLADIPSIFKRTESFSRSDQLAFANAGIPAILTMEGLDYENISTEEGIEKFIEFSQKYYHTPFDDLNLPINYSAAIQHIEFIVKLIYNIADSDAEPEWHEDSPFINARLRTIAEQR